MSRAKRVRFCGEAAGHRQAVGLLKEAGDVALDVRGVRRSIVMKCPDGCGDVVTINLDRRAGQAWRIDLREGKLTLYPSVWREGGCKAHFILWRDCILWCDWGDEATWRSDELVAAVRHELQRQSDFVHFESIAEALGIIPWEALWASQLLVRSGEAEIRDRTFFRLGRATAPSSRRGWWA